ncbi:KAP family NTPase [Providencia rettgeri]|uniref:KAP family NTPase n=1 Tax=Providencia rettgeri TaxID=587 RepID=UPI001E39C9A2|nr:KAP family NTPase [Providencia rettgeri]UEK58861.1 KAP family NTPase [Providencia rettgeri]
MNKHLTTYLDYYRTLEKPGYAVLVTGDWGCGKTYQIKKYFRDHEICYVSLFSINSIDDIYATVFAKMYPKKAIVKKLVGGIGDVDAKISESVTFGLGGILSRVGSALIKENVDNKKIIVFDDLERAIYKKIINVNEFLGVINNYIEHAGCKVIVIAHDGEIPAGFENTKEKVIGQTIKVNSDINGALDAFLVNSDLKRKYPKIKNVLLSAFEQSGYSSLRVLKYIINDCDRLYEKIKNSKLKDNENVLYDFFYYFIVLCIEFKNEKLSCDEYINHRQISLEYQMELLSDKEVSIPNIYLISNKYNNFNFSSELISKESIVKIVLDGYFDYDKINDEIDNSNYFKKEEEKPSWYKLLEFDKLDYDSIELVIREVNTDFKKRTFNKFGDIYHLFNCMFLIEMLNNKNPNYNKIISDCKKYIDEIVNAERIEIRNPEKDDFDMIFSSYEGKAFWIEPAYTSHSQDVLSYINEKMYEAYYKQQEKYEVLDKMKNNLNQLIKDLTQYPENYGEYCEIPILAKINPLQFVNTWLSLPASNQREISSLLHSRYGMGRLSRSLKDEKTWLKNVFRELDIKAKSMTGFHAYRIKRLKLKIPTE